MACRRCGKEHSSLICNPELVQSRKDYRDRARGEAAMEIAAKALGGPAIAKPAKKKGKRRAKP